MIGRKDRKAAFKSLQKHSQNTNIQTHTIHAMAHGNTEAAQDPALLTPAPWTLASAAGVNHCLKTLTDNLTQQP